jgi:hypothetical protein
MKPKVVLIILLLGCMAVTVATPFETFKGNVGLQLYSLREQFKKDVPATLDQVRAFGITHVELAGTYGVALEKFKQELDARNSKPSAGTFRMNNAATISTTLFAKRSCLVSNTPVARGFRTKIHLMKRLRVRQRQSSIAPAAVCSTT